MKAAVVKKISNDDSVNWKEYPLEEVLDVIRGISFKSTEKLSEKGIDSVACLRTANVQADVDWDDLWWVPESFVKRQEQFVRQHDILMSNANSYELVGKVSLVKSVPTKATLGAFITLLRSREGFDPKFLFYQLRSARLVNEIRSRASTTTNISNVSTGKLRDIPLFCPSLEQQKKIVAKIEELFSHIDAGINALKQSKQLLKQYRQSVLKAAVTGELSKEWREQNKDKLEPASKLLERILQERRQKWEAQQLEQFKAKGKVPKDEGWKEGFSEPKNPICKYQYQPPESWALVSLDQIVADTLIGLVRSNEKQFFGETGVPYLKMNNLDMNGGINLEGLVNIEVSNEELIRYALKNGDILFNTRNSVELVGKTAMATVAISGFVFNNNIMRIRLSRFAFPEFFAMQMCALPFRAEMEKIKKATTSVAAVYGKDLFPLPLLLPTLGEQIEIVRIAEGRLIAIDQIEKSIDSELQRSERLKQSVLQSAFGGKLVSV
jgi:type I restriction enzyme S subunit